MHDLLQEMAHVIVRQESIQEMGKRSRLWNHADVYQVLTKNLGSEEVEGIFLDTSKIPKVNLSSRAFANMHNLRLLKIYNAGFANNCKLYLPDGLDSLSDKLSYLHWEEYPLSSMPPNFKAENLVELNLSHSNVEQLWSGAQHLVSLKEMNLSNCKNLLAIPDLTLAKNLESLIFTHCTSLEEVHPSIRFLDRLVDLDMRCCTSLMSLPTGVKWRSLKTLNVSGCFYLSRFPEFSANLTYLNLNETAIEELSESIGKASGLITLNLKDCKQLRNLPESMHLLKALVIIDLSGCSKITWFPNICGEVKYLYLSGTSIVEIPSSIGLLSKLLCLDLMNCKKLKNLPRDISKLISLEQLVLSGCSSVTKFPEVSMRIKKLFLDGTAIEEIPSSVEYSFELAELNLKNCTRLHTLPSSICKLKHLQKLNLSGCCVFEKFPKILEDMNSLRYLYLDGTAIKELPSPIQKLKALSSLELKDCRYLCLYGINFLDNLPKEGLKIQYLRKLYLNSCGLFVVPQFIGGLSSLEALDLSGNPFTEITLSLKELFELQYLGVRNCIHLKSLPEPPPNLAKLDAHGCLNLSSVSMDQDGAKGNIFEFIFTNCNNLVVKHQIVSHALTKFQLYAKRLDSQVPFVPVGESSFCFPRCHNLEDDLDNQVQLKITSCRFATEIQLPSGCAKNDFLGFIICAVIAFKGVSDKSGLRVKCKYHFQNKNGDSNDLHCYFGGWYDARIVRGEHLFIGYDPCVDLRNDDYWFHKYSKVTIQFFLEDISGNPLQCCVLVGCGASHLMKYTSNTLEKLVRRRADLKTVTDSSGYASQDMHLASWNRYLKLLKFLPKLMAPSITGLNSRYRKKSSSYASSTSMPQTPMSEGEISQSSNLKAFSLSELKIATRNFRLDSLLVEGSFGSVFKGWIDEHSLTATKLGSGIVIAVKRLHQGHQGHKEWLAEINYLGKLQHPNLVKLIGYCFEDEHKLLVHEFMPHGSMENHLFCRGSHVQPLSWNIRIKVAHGAARGLAFLHNTETKVIYRDFKTSKILLDSNYNPKLSDFGLARDVPIGYQSHVSTRVMGTYGIAAPEYIARGHLTAKSDVYSFGVVLLEILSGLRAIDNWPKLQDDLVHWAKPYLTNKHRVLSILDTRIEGQYSLSQAQKLATLALKCLDVNPKFRPDMDEVVKELEQLSET